MGHKIYEVEKDYSIVVWTIGMKTLILKDENNLMGVKHKQRRSTTKDFYIPPPSSPHQPSPKSKNKLKKM